METNIIENGEILESRLQNKKVLYILFNNAPSATVRALSFKSEYLKYKVKVDFFFMSVNFIENLATRACCFDFFMFILRVFRKLCYIYKQHNLLKIVKNYDTIVTIKYINSKLLSQIKAKTRAKILYDFDDAVWLDSYFVGENEFRKVITLADVTTSDNHYLAKRASEYNKNSFVVNGPSQIELFTKISKMEREDEQIILGWIGSSSTLFYLYKIYEVLETVGEKYPNVVLKIVGTQNRNDLIPPFEKIKTITIPWYDQFEMVKQVYTFDIGLYPLFYNELSLGRGSLKATIYMSAKVPVICSAIGENKNIIIDRKNGFLAETPEDWLDKLSLLIDDKKFRVLIGQKGFEYVQKYYSTAYCFKQLLIHL